MAEITVKIPEGLEGEAQRIEREIEELVSTEEKRKLLSRFVDEVMKGAKQLSEEELVKLGREVKRGRAAKLREMGLV